MMDNWYVNDYIVTANFMIHAKVHDESTGKIILFVDNLLMCNGTVSTNIYEKIWCSKKEKKTN